MAEVTVIILTRGRVAQLRRAIASVTAQRCDAVVNCHVMVDDCPATREMLEGTDSLPPGLVWRFLPRVAGERSGIHRVAKLRNAAVRAAHAGWIAFLDDDNEWTADHLATLLDCARREVVRAVHSHMEILWPDGTPYLDARKPWSRDDEDGFRLYQEWVRRGIFQPGSNVARDRMDPLEHPDPARTVDIGEWLIDRELLLRTPLCEEYDDREREHFIGEDDKLMSDLLRRGERISCTELPTLRYYLGGFSNQFALRGG